MTTVAGPQQLGAFHDIGPVKPARVRDGEHHLTVLRERREQAKRGVGQVCEPEHHHPPRQACVQAGRGCARGQRLDHPFVYVRSDQRGVAGGERTDDPLPQGRLPELGAIQCRGAPPGIAQHGLARGPALEPVRAMHLVLIVKIGDSAGELVATERVARTQIVGKRCEHGIGIGREPGEPVHQPPGERGLVERRAFGNGVRAQHRPIQPPLKLARQLQPGGRADAVLLRKRHLEPLGRAIALHQTLLGFERSERMALDESRHLIAQVLDAVAVEHEEGGREGRG